MRTGEWFTDSDGAMIEVIPLLPESEDLTQGDDSSLEKTLEDLGFREGEDGSWMKAREEECNRREENS